MPGLDIMKVFYKSRKLWNNLRGYTYWVQFFTSFSDAVKIKNLEKGQSTLEEGETLVSKTFIVRVLSARPCGATWKLRTRIWYHTLE